MYQDPQQYASTSNTFLTHAVPSVSSTSQVMNAGPSGNNSVAPLDTTTQPQPPPSQAALANQTSPLIATGDWTKDLVQLAKTAELKKHALTLQFHTSHILSSHASLEQKNKAIQDIREQKNKLESERTRLLNCLREINEDRDKADLLEASITKECGELRATIAAITDGEYAIAKQDVDRLRLELGQPPLPSLQSALDEKSSQYLNERRLNGDGQTQKRSATESPLDRPPTSGKRPRGRPKGSKNRAKGAANPSEGA